MVRGDDTRGRILDTAWALIAERGAAEVRVGDVATAAGVSRQLVYFHFANRAGLLGEMARRFDRTHGFIDAVVAARELPPAEAFEALVRAWLAHIPRIVLVARALEATYMRGEDGGETWAERMDQLHEAFRLAVERLEADGRLRAGWTVDQATDWTWSRCHLDAWHHLVVDRGWEPGEASERLARSVLAEVVA